MGEPDFYTVEEAADRLRIGRTAAYLAAKEYRLTGGAEGLPVIAIRGSLRVPRRKLEEWAGGRLGEPDGARPEAGARAVATKQPTRRAAKKRPTTSGQGSLPFTD